MRGEVQGERWDLTFAHTLCCRIGVDKVAFGSAMHTRTVASWKCEMTLACLSHEQNDYLGMPDDYCIACDRRCGDAVGDPFELCNKGVRT